MEDLEGYEAHRALVRRAAETHNSRDREGFLACYSNPISVVWGDRALSVTHDEHWDAVLHWAEVFEGFSEEIQQMITEGDLVFLRSLYRGVHHGIWKSLAPTGRAVEWEAWQVLRIADGLIVEERMLMDEWSLFEQLAQPESGGSNPVHEPGGRDQ